MHSPNRQCGDLKALCAHRTAPSTRRTSSAVTARYCALTDGVIALFRALIERQCSNRTAMRAKLVRLHTGPCCKVAFLAYSLIVKILVAKQLPTNIHTSGAHKRGAYGLLRIRYGAYISRVSIFAREFGGVSAMLETPPIEGHNHASALKPCRDRER